MDGVFNTGNPKMYDDYEDYIKGECKATHFGFKSLINNFLPLLNDPSVRIVVISHWREKTLERTRNALNSMGIPKDKIIGQTPSMGRYSVRGNEIHAWMIDNKFFFDFSHKSSYVIIDDSSDMLYWHKDNFVLVDSWCGFTWRCFTKCKEILDIDVEINTLRLDV